MQRTFSNHRQKRCSRRKRCKAGLLHQLLTCDWLQFDQECRWPKGAERLQTAKQEIRNLSSTRSHKELNSANNLNEFASDSYNLQRRAQAEEPAFESCKPGTEKPAGFTRPSDVQNNKFVLFHVAKFVIISYGSHRKYRFLRLFYIREWNLKCYYSHYLLLCGNSLD